MLQVLYTVIQDVWTRWSAVYYCSRTGTVAGYFCTVDWVVVIFPGSCVLYRFCRDTGSRKLKVTDRDSYSIGGSICHLDILNYIVPDPVVRVCSVLVIFYWTEDFFTDQCQTCIFSRRSAHFPMRAIVCISNDNTCGSYFSQ